MNQKELGRLFRELGKLFDSKRRQVMIRGGFLHATTKSSTFICYAIRACLNGSTPFTDTSKGYYSSSFYYFIGKNLEVLISFQPFAGIWLLVCHTGLISRPHCDGDSISSPATISSVEVIETSAIKYKPLSRYNYYQIVSHEFIPKTSTWSLL